MLSALNGQTYLFSDNGELNLISNSISNYYWIGQSAGNLVYISQSVANTTTISA
jgi:hypothetical protein